MLVTGIETTQRSIIASNEAIPRVSMTTPRAAS
jgi:hypothetical protein